MYKASYCLPCLYMDETVLEILPEYDQYIDYRRVDFMHSPGKERFLGISCELFGEEAVRKRCRVAPVSSIYIDGKLAFDTTLGSDELKECLNRLISACAVVTSDRVNS